MDNFLRTKCLIVLCLTLSGCSFFSPVQVEPAFTYRIDSIPSVSVRHPHHASILMVMPPETSPLYNTTEMAYTKFLHQVSYFAKNSWIETPSQMLQPLIVETLRDTHHFAAVNTLPIMGSFDYLLSTQIIKFEQDFTVSPSVFRLNLHAQVLRVATNRVIASKDILVEEPAFQNTPYGGVVAANQAVRRALTILAKFCEQKIR